MMQKLQKTKIPETIHKIQKILESRCIQSDVRPRASLDFLLYSVDGNSDSLHVNAITSYFNRNPNSVEIQSFMYHLRERILQICRLDVFPNVVLNRLVGTLSLLGMAGTDLNVRGADYHDDTSHSFYQDMVIRVVMEAMGNFCKCTLNNEENLRMYMNLSAISIFLRDFISIQRSRCKDSTAIWKLNSFIYSEVGK